MRSHIHVHGSKLTPSDLITEATGKEPSSDDFIEYLTSKYSKIYNKMVAPLGFEPRSQAPKA